ncbi:MAG: hypothetical protein RML38_11560, partial [Bacteroidia bacterium]|nr:hypothetical protein [Bacteroidia bacterium]
ECKLHERGSHAGVGAFVALSIFGNLFSTEGEVRNILSPMATAIMRHHSPVSTTFNEYNICNNGLDEFLKLYDELEITWKYEDKRGRLRKSEAFPIDRYLVNPEGDAIANLMYFFLVRILRLCDQKATDDLNNFC